MPDTKFSWRGLREHLRKYFWIYLVAIGLSLVGTSLLWTTTRPRVPNEQNVIVFMADAYSNSIPLEDVARDMLERTKEFDDTLMEVEFQSLQYSDQDYSGPMLLMTRLAVGEGDAFLASQVVMDSLVQSDALVRLDESVAGGWLAEYPLEPYYATVVDEETGESETYLAGLRLDEVDVLASIGAFNNEGAFLCVAGNDGNVETTMKALEYMMEDLMALSTEESDAGTENTEPAA